jgi:Sel1 repeat
MDHQFGDAVMKSVVEVFLTAAILTLPVLHIANAAEGSNQAEAAASTYRAAVQGSADAQARLGALYANGDGVEQSDAAAIQWLMRAAEQGHAKAQLMLADFWAIGRSVPRHEPIAYKWASLAKANASDGQTREEAQQLLVVLGRRMSPQDFADAKRQVDAWSARVETLPSNPAESSGMATSSPLTPSKRTARRSEPAQYTTASDPHPPSPRAKSARGSHGRAAARRSHSARYEYEYVRTPLPVWARRWHY